MPSPGSCEFVRAVDFTPAASSGSSGSVTWSVRADDEGVAPGPCAAPDLPGVIEALVASAVSGGCEGVMAKPLTGAGAGYVPGSRTKAWAKLKKDAAGGVGGDTIDVVPVAAYVRTWDRPWPWAHRADVVLQRQPPTRSFMSLGVLQERCSRGRRLVLATHVCYTHQCAACLVVCRSVRNRRRAGGWARAGEPLAKAPFSWACLTPRHAAGCPCARSAQGSQTTSWWPSEAPCGA